MTAGMKGTMQSLQGHIAHSWLDMVRHATLLALSEVWLLLGLTFQEAISGSTIASSLLNKSRSGSLCVCRCTLTIEHKQVYGTLVASGILAAFDRVCASSRNTARRSDKLGSATRRPALLGLQAHQLHDIGRKLHANSQTKLIRYARARHPSKISQYVACRGESE